MVIKPKEEVMIFYFGTDQEEVEKSVKESQYIHNYNDENTFVYPELDMIDPKERILFAINLIDKKDALVGTYSEYIALTILKAIREGLLTPDNTRFIVIRKKPRGGFYTKEMEVNKKGNFDNRWPGGFFDDRRDLIFHRGSSIDGIKKEIIENTDYDKTIIK